MKPKIALVTGGAGFIGSHLTEALLSDGCEVRVIDDLSTGHLSNLRHIRDRITFYQGDIRDQELLTKASRGCDVIFHEAAVVSVPKTVEDPINSATVNEMGTLFVFEAARQNNVKRVVYASSSAVYGDDPALPKHETMRPKPQSPYAVQKLSGEIYARLYLDLYGVETVSLRYFNVYGPRQDPSSPYSGVISIFMTKATSKETPVIYGDGEQYRDFIYVKDVVRANLLAAVANGASGGIFNIGRGKITSINSLWEMISKRVGFDIKPKYEPSRAGDIRESVADVNSARKALGFEPDYSFEKGIGNTLEWYQGQSDKK
jgi:nucleoside-diphosphate-sugar epimerase